MRMTMEKILKEEICMHKCNIYEYLRNPQQSSLWTIR